MILISLTKHIVTLMMTVSGAYSRLELERESLASCSGLRAKRDLQFRGSRLRIARCTRFMCMDVTTSMVKYASPLLHNFLSSSILLLARCPRTEVVDATPAGRAKETRILTQALHTNLSSLE